MALFNPYLHFTGNTEEAFNFYKSVLGGEFIKLVRYKDLAPAAEYAIPEPYLDKIMYIALPLGKNNMLLGSDAMLEHEGRKFTFGDNFHIAISAESKEEADHLFTGLSADGKIDMPIEDSSWGTYFGMLTDKFGVQWTVDFDPNL
ncbi:PhnB protein [Pedobacter psychrotolerans]|uniref:PhnB protein n=1 Tax=Pedobacter psychrotolerans TaxID=1843235 RepID=A0A4R2HQM5_9SPHI|nr:VOC family protein [Pedobacter psychrotolerans]TCO31151.1 PhnB protein [Pedobacter psychrotolerans]GGE41891.1 VOC family protein [Pedobacter psychrotolerans]